MERYKHLNYEERTKLYELKQLGQSIAQIASTLKRSRSTVWREFKRNEAPPGFYWPDTAERLSLERRQKQCRLDQDDKLKDFVITKLCCHYWTPEQIAGWLKHRQTRLPSICHESIYAWVYRPSQKKEKLWKFLPRHKAKRGLRKSKGASACRIPNRISIHERPKHIENRRVFGHWEGDLMSFCKNSQHSLVLRERKTMFTLSSPLETKQAVQTAKRVIDLMKDLPSKARKTLTLDNGGEFASHDLWANDLGLKSFFCGPYASWQKGGVENTNGRLRRDLPRKTNIHQLSQEDFNETILNYNTTPRKSLGWFTPLEAFNKNLRRVALQT